MPTTTPAPAPPRTPLRASPEAPVRTPPLEGGCAPANAPARRTRRAPVRRPARAPVRRPARAPVGARGCARSGRTLAHALALAAGLLGGLGALVPAGLSGQREIVVEDLHAEMQVREDGGVLVVETLRVRFRGPWNGVVRTLSLRPPAHYKARYVLQAELISATDEEGRPLRYEVRSGDRTTREFRVWVPDARDRVATVVLTYRVRNALGFFAAAPDGEWEAMDELYWNVTGTDWQMPILRASATVRLPPGADPVQVAAYAGLTDSPTRAGIRAVPGGAEVPAVGPLPPGHGLTIGVGWPAGFVARPDGPAGRDAPGPGTYWPLLLPLAVATVAYRAWSRRGRDPRPRAITVQWEPPAGLRPAEAGTLVDHRVDMRDVLSILVDLAVRGYLVIEERKREGFFAGARDYTFHLMRPEEAWAELATFERRFLGGLFAARRSPDLVAALGGRSEILRAVVTTFTGDAPPARPPAGTVHSVRLSDLRDRFHTVIPRIHDDLYDSLVARGHYHERPDRARWLWLLFSFLGVGFGVAVIAGLDHLVPAAIAAPAALAAAAFASAAILGVFGWLMPARTEKGARAREAALGFRRFLERVEQPRYARMVLSPERFEEFLPYAMAFGCEDRWARAFDGLLRTPPNWYHGHGPATTFRPSRFARDLGRMSTAAATTLSSSPRSSGSGGGGRVGGGGGGGGGRGF
jgi:hypothetical protein